MDLYLSPEKALSLARCRQFQERLKRRALHEPLQYITGKVEFCDFSLMVRPGVFIPRPETELIVEESKVLFPYPKQILELCTGSGALAIALARQFPQAKVWATDLSHTALSLALDNIEGHQLASRITLLKGNLCEPLVDAPNVPKKFDLIACNPPYISEKDRPGLPPEVRDYEPEAALFAPESGYAFYRRILLEAPQLMRDQALLLLEMGAGQSDWLSSFVEKKTAFSLRFIRDWVGIKRVAYLKLGPSDG